MATKKVAVEGEVNPSVRDTLTYPSPAVSGTWSPGPVSYKKISFFLVNSTAVIFEAKCTFTFAGSDSNGVAVPGSEDVTLSANPTTLKPDNENLLVDGDNEESSYGNKLEVVAQGHLWTD